MAHHLEATPQAGSTRSVTSPAHREAEALAPTTSLSTDKISAIQIPRPPKPDAPIANQASAAVGPSSAIQYHRNVLVTPVMAKRWLRHHNTHNREMGEDRVESYARDMVAGHWLDTGETIKFSESGVLLDGQKRLAAIARAGIPVYMNIAHGVPEGAQRAMDSGEPRSTADQLYIAGDKTTSTQVSTWIHALHYLLHKEQRHLSDVECQEIMKRYQTGIEWGTKVVQPRLPFCRAPIMAALILGHSKEPKKTNAFFKSVKTGAELKMGQPAHTFREFILRRTACSRRDLALKTLRALQAHCEGDKLLRLEATEGPLFYFVDKDSIPELLPSEAPKRGRGGKAPRRSNDDED